MLAVGTGWRLAGNRWGMIGYTAALIVFVAAVVGIVVVKGRRSSGPDSGGQPTGEYPVIDRSKGG
jgi:hypothetical protein